MKRIHYLIAFTLGVLAVLGILGILKHSAPCQYQYDLLSPARRCSNLLSQGEWNYELLRDALSMKKEEWKTAGDVTHLSIYFQDLDHGPRFGIGEYDKFQPASLIKVPLLIYFLHVADLDPHILDKTLSYSGTLKTEDNVRAPEQTIHPDTPYTIRDLLRKMIVYSDNRSYTLLLREMNALSEEIAYYTFRDLDVLQMMLDTKMTYVSISSYARLFAILYNTGYLSKDMSQFALELLSEATFKEGIVTGVPDDMRVAHKFGYAFVDGENQLHDCGIVYHPQMAYILCIMTIGADPNKASSVIAGISRMVYEGVSVLKFDRMEEDPQVNI